jgi:hypothetical protein
MQARSVSVCRESSSEADDISLQCGRREETQRSWRGDGENGNASESEASRTADCQTAGGTQAHDTINIWKRCKFINLDSPGLISTISGPDYSQAAPREGGIHRDPVPALRAGAFVDDLQSISHHPSMCSIVGGADDEAEAFRASWGSISVPRGFYQMYLEFAQRFHHRASLRGARAIVACSLVPSWRGTEQSEI